ncbi:hypothetical protein SeMB42_g03463 [Synchytrium endobioticum]|uniref:Protein OS-9 homolog n=1 Tax=Synchytrium endobioticum TaxID=286115 RepID=A0A507D6I6_9FUNG|nr:hypothetical protein SeMB42_g03463 [Synchytrium endobioticum]
MPSHAWSLVCSLLALASLHSAYSSSLMDSVYADLHRSPAYKLVVSPKYQTPPASDETHQQILALPMPGTGQLFQCQILHTPSNTRQFNLSDPAIRQEALTNALAQLEPLKKTDCLYYFKDWWTFEFCYGSHVRQFHQPASPQEAQDPNVRTEYILGRSKPALAAKPATTLPASELMDAPKEGKRSVEVQFHCGHQVADHIALARETATCQYLVVVHTSRLCRDVAFLAPQSARPTVIECSPIAPSLPSSSHDEQKQQVITTVKDAPEFHHSVFNNAADKGVDVQRGDEPRVLVRKPSRQHPYHAPAPAPASNLRDSPLQLLSKTLSQLTGKVHDGEAAEGDQDDGNVKVGDVGIKVIVLKDDGHHMVVGGGKKQSSSSSSSSKEENGATDRNILEGTFNSHIDTLENSRERVELLIDTLLASLLHDNLAAGSETSSEDDNESEEQSSQLENEPHHRQDEPLHGKEEL